MNLGQWATILDAIAFALVAVDLYRGRLGVWQDRLARLRDRRSRRHSAWVRLLRRRQRAPRVSHRPRIAMSLTIVTALVALAALKWAIGVEFGGRVFFALAAAIAVAMTWHRIVRILVAAWPGLLELGLFVASAVAAVITRFAAAKPLGWSLPLLGAVIFAVARVLSFVAAE